MKKIVWQIRKRMAILSDKAIVSCKLGDHCALKPLNTRGKINKKLSAKYLTIVTYIQRFYL